jgi:hypothetical protein
MAKSMCSWAPTSRPQALVAGLHATSQWTCCRRRPLLEAARVLPDQDQSGASSAPTQQPFTRPASEAAATAGIGGDGSQTSRVRTRRRVQVQRQEPEVQPPSGPSPLMIGGGLVAGAGVLYLAYRQFVAGKQGSSLGGDSLSKGASALAAGLAASMVRMGCLLQ